MKLRILTVAGVLALGLAACQQKEEEVAAPAPEAAAPAAPADSMAATPPATTPPADTGAMSGTAPPADAGATPPPEGGAPK